MEHFISKLGDRDLAKRVTLLRLLDVDDMEETLRAYQRMEKWYTKASMGPGILHQQQKASWGLGTVKIDPSSTSDQGGKREQQFGVGPKWI